MHKNLNVPYFTLSYLIFLKLSPKPFTAFSSYDLASNSTKLQISF